MARQRLPTLHPEPIMLRLTTGLMKGSRRPARLICLGASAFASLGFFWSSTAMRCLGSDFLLATALAELCLAAAFFATGRAATLAATGWLPDGLAEVAALPGEF